MSVKQAIEPEDFNFFDYRNYTFSLGLTANGVAWLSGHSASQYDPRIDQIIVTGEMADQVEVAHDKIETILRAAAMTWQNVIKIIDYTTIAGLGTYALAASGRRERLGSHRPTITCAVVDRLLRPAALIECEVMATNLPIQTFSAREETSSAMPGAEAVRVGDMVYVAGQVATGSDGRIEHRGDLVAQTRMVFEKIEDSLQKAGVSTKQIVKTVDYVHWSARDSYRGTGDVRRQFLDQPYPAATGIVVNRLPHPEALIQVEVVAYDGPREAVNPGWDRYRSLTYSPAVRAGEYLFLSGQFSMNPETVEPVYVDDIVSQTKYVYENLMKVLEAGGCSESDMIKTVEYVVGKGVPDYRRTAKVRQNIFSRPYPAATGAVIPELLWPGMLIEIDSTARVP